MILAYAGDHSLNTITQDDAKRLSHVNIAFGKVGRDFRMDDHELNHLHYLRQIRKWNPDIRFVLSVGGWGAGGFSNMAKTAEGREIFAGSCAEYVRKNALDGIDIDWEYPCSDSAGIDATPEDRENFTLLLAALRNALGKEKIVSIAAGAGDYFVRDTQMDRVAEICDYVQIMTYDMRSGFCSQAGHHTSLYPGAGDDSRRNTRDAVDMFHEAGVPLEKIVIGAAFYSRKWGGVPDAGVHGLLQQAQTLGDYGPGYGKLVMDYIDRNGWKRYWDDEAKAPYLFNGDSLISYDDPDSIREKCLYVKEKGLLGIMYWEHGCDETHSLLRTMAETL